MCLSVYVRYGCGHRIWCTDLCSLGQPTQTICEYGQARSTEEIQDGWCPDCLAYINSKDAGGTAPDAADPNIGKNEAGHTDLNGQ